MMPVSSGMLRKVLASMAALSPHSMQTERIVSHHNIIVDDYRSCLASETVNARSMVAQNRVGIAPQPRLWSSRSPFVENESHACLHEAILYSKIWPEKFCCCRSNFVELTPRSRPISNTISVLCTFENSFILQSIWNTSLAPPWQFRL